MLMGAPDLTYQFHSRTSIYTACESLDFHWDLKDVLEFDRMWNEGLCITDIARAFSRSVNEVAILALDRSMKGQIKNRPNGVYGRRMPHDI